MRQAYQHPESTTNLRWLMYLFVLPVVCYSQILNGSFEKDGQPSLDNWTIICDQGIPIQDTPDDGGVWCLRLAMGNYQGCYPSRAEQVIPDVRQGDIIQVSAWAKQDKLKDSPTSLYLKIYHAKGEATTLSVDTTTSEEWVKLTVTDTLKIDEGDSVAIVLDPGTTSGPQILNSDSYFDLVEEKKIGEIVSAGDNYPQHKPEEFGLLQNYPNPFNPTTVIGYRLPVISNVELNIFNLLGQKVAVLVKERQNAGEHKVQFEGSGLASGVYFYQLRAGSYVSTKKLLLLR